MKLTSSTTLSREQVLERTRSMPSFPTVVSQIIATLDDTDSTITIVAKAISRDPLICARVLATANTVTLRGQNHSPVWDLFSAISLIGLNRVRHITLISALSGFWSGSLGRKTTSGFWQHSVCAGIACEEVALQTACPVSASLALIAGLLHDIGQLWLYHLNPTLTPLLLEQSRQNHICLSDIERDYFGVNHATIGKWLAEHWALPPAVSAAIGCHHQPNQALEHPLVSLVHVAEVICNALDLPSREENQVTYLSQDACQQLGLDWSDSNRSEIRSLFGRIEARSQHALTFFNSPQP